MKKVVEKLTCSKCNFENNKNSINCTNCKTELKKVDDSQIPIIMMIVAIVCHRIMIYFSSYDYFDNSKLQLYVISIIGIINLISYFIFFKLNSLVPKELMKNIIRKYKKLAINYFIILGGIIFMTVFVNPWLLFYAILIMGNPLLLIIILLMPIISYKIYLKMNINGL